MTLTHIKPERLWLKDHPALSELWVQDRIAEDPSLLGLGDLVLKGKECVQPRAGRLDLLLQDPDANKRYEVEVQLGKSDEAHIIRTIEHWDIERKRYPQYDHTAVIVAENIAPRFLSIISLFNGSIPLVAIQMNAVKFGEHVSLLCSTMLGEGRLGLVDEDQEVQKVTDRAYREKRGPDRFEPAYYIRVYPDAPASPVEAWLHYRLFGIKEGRSPNPFFDPKFYLSEHPDLAQALGATNYASALEHWLVWGIREGRKGSNLRIVFLTGDATGVRYVSDGCGNCATEVAALTDAGYPRAHDLRGAVVTGDLAAAGSPDHRGCALGGGANGRAGGAGGGGGGGRVGMPGHTPS